MTTPELINGILEREGGYQDDPADAGNGPHGATNWGITAKSWGAYRQLGRVATRDEVKAITREQAVDFYRSQYVLTSPFRLVGYEPLQVQLIDFSVNSGTARATRWLQRVLDVPVTSVLDDRTRLALTRDRGALVNRALVAARCSMISGSVREGSIAEKFEQGLIRRAVSFLDLPPAESRDPVVNV